MWFWNSNSKHPSSVVLSQLLINNVTKRKIKKANWSSSFYKNQKQCPEILTERKLCFIHFFQLQFSLNSSIQLHRDGRKLECLKNTLLLFLSLKALLVGYNCQCRIKDSCAKRVEQEEDLENGIDRNWCSFESSKWREGGNIFL